MNGIALGVNENGRPYVTSQFDKELNINDDESMLAAHFLSLLEEKVPSSATTLERRSDNYLSLCANGTDFLRFKYTSRSKWISLDVWQAEIRKDDPRFAAQKNKNQRFWKATINGLDDLDSFDDLVIEIVKNARDSTQSTL